MIARARLPAILTAVFLFALSLQAAPAPAALSGPRVAQLGLLTADEGWVLMEGRLFWTADGGRSWSERALPAGEGQPAAVTFVDAQAGYAVLIQPGPAYALAASADGVL